MPGPFSYFLARFSYFHMFHQLLAHVSPTCFLKTDSVRAKTETKLFREGNVNFLTDSGVSPFGPAHRCFWIARLCLWIGPPAPLDRPAGAFGSARRLLWIGPPAALDRPAGASVLCNEEIDCPRQSCTPVVKNSLV